MSLDQLTTRQREVFDFIKEKIRGRGYGPTVREIGEYFEISSPNGVMCHLKALEKKGYLRRDPNRPPKKKAPTPQDMADQMAEQVRGVTGEDPVESAHHESGGRERRERGERPRDPRSGGEEPLHLLDFRRGERCGRSRGEHRPSMHRARDGFNPRSFPRANTSGRLQPSAALRPPSRSPA